MKNTIIKLSVVVLTLLLSGCGGTPSTPADTNQSAIDNGGTTTPNADEPNVENGDNDTPTTPNTDEPNVDNGGNDTPTTPNTDEPNVDNGGSDTPTNEPPVEVVVDNTPPVITVSGENPFTITQGDTYADAGATATDDVDGEIEVVPSGEVIMSVAGTYTITYTAVDEAGHEVNATRTVIVKPADVIWNVSNMTEFRDALESAALNGTGDKIILEKGTYNIMSDNFGTLSFYDNEEFNLTIEAKGDLTYSDVILDGNNTQQVFNFDNKSDATLIIKNISVINGKTSLDGGGIYSLGGVLVEDCNISKNTATHKYGGGIYATKGVTITNSIVSYNTSVNSGGGFYAKGTGTVINSTILYNTTTGIFDGYFGNYYSQGGGFCSIGTTTVTNSTISYNTSTGSGGFKTSNETTVINSTISYNTSSHSNGGGFSNSEGGQYDSMTGPTTVINSTISNNISKYYGGGLYLNGDINITSSTISNNISGSNGGGLYVQYIEGSYYIKPQTTITESIFSDNNASSIYSGGGAIYTGDKLDISNSSFINNTADNYGTLKSTSRVIMVNSLIANSNNAVDTSHEYYKSYFSNNVFMNNTENALTSEGVFVNNIFVDNENDISLNGDTSVYNNYIDETKIIKNGETVYIKFNLEPSDVGDIYLSDDNVTLLSNSPVIDKGLNIGSTTYKDMVDDETVYARLNELLTTDKVGNVRVFGDLVDMGAVEYGSSK